MKTTAYLAVLAYLGVTTTTLVKAVQLTALQGDQDNDTNTNDVDDKSKTFADVERMFANMNMDGNQDGNGQGGNGQEGNGDEDGQGEGGMDASEGIFRGGVKKSYYNYGDGGRQSGPAYNINYNYDNGIPGTFSTGLIMPEEDLSCGDCSCGDCGCSGNDFIGGDVCRFDTTLTDVHLKVPERRQAQTYRTNNQDLVEIKSSSSTGLADSSTNCATAQNESGTCLISNKSVGTGDTLKVYSITGKITVDQHTQNNECAGERMSMDARQTSTTECINLNNVGCLGDGPAIEVNDRECGVSDFREEIRPTVPAIRPPLPPGPPGPPGPPNPTNSNGVQPRPANPVTYKPQYAPNSEFQRMTKRVGENPYDTQPYGIRRELSLSDIAGSTPDQRNEQQNNDEGNIEGDE